MPPFDWTAVRSEFPALSHWTFLNTATFGQLPRRATEAVSRHFTHRDELACSDFLQWFDDVDGIRAQIARLIRCQAADIAFIPNAATALSMLIGGIQWKPGDRLVTLQDEFPNNLYFPALMARHGVEFIETPFEELEGAVTKRTRLIAVSSVNYRTGFRPPLDQMSRIARDRGSLLYVDGTQSLGALQFDCGSLRPDLFAVHGYKWLLAPNGGGFMYVAPEVREWLAPNVVGWRSHHEWRGVDNLHHAAPVFVETAEKYEGGMLNFSALYAMSASIELILEIGPARIESRVLDLADKVRQVLRDAGAAVVGEGSENYASPVVSARFDGVDPSHLARELKARRVLVSARHGNLRVSPHFYNDESDIERFAHELRSLTAL